MLSAEVFGADELSVPRHLRHPLLCGLPTAVHARTAPLRRSGGYDARIRPSDVGVMSAAPAAWTIRAAIRSGTLSTTAQTADATVKIAMPRRNP